MTKTRTIAIHVDASHLKRAFLIAELSAIRLKTQQTMREFDAAMGRINEILDADRRRHSMALASAKMERM